MKTTRTFFLGLALGVLAQFPALAFGGMVAGKTDASLYSEASQVVLVRDGNRTVMSILNDYTGPLAEFVMVVPTPTLLQKGQVGIASRQMFERLDAYSSPRLQEYQDKKPCQLGFAWMNTRYPQSYRERTPSTVASINPSYPSLAYEDESLADDVGVKVEARYTLKEYDIVSLSATQSDGLETWLRRNGYLVPKGNSAALKPYIQQGMKFLVAKVNLQELAKTGATTLQPLQFAFESKQFMLPLRLGVLNAPSANVQDVIVYALTRQGRVESSNYRNLRLPTDVNLPFFTRQRFQDVYNAMLDNRLRQEPGSVVFTEYAWDLSRCNPCAALPLSLAEQRAAGVFWVDGRADAQFRAMRAPGGVPFAVPVAPPIAYRFMSEERHPVSLTRLHLRYSTDTPPQDLVLAQTHDKETWQTRYVIQHPYTSSVAACSEQMAQEDCVGICRNLVKYEQSLPHDYMHSITGGGGTSGESLQSSCVSACTASRQTGVDAAVRYYQQSLPERLRIEKQSLADLTGWSLEQIDQMPDARKFSP